MLLGGGGEGQYATTVRTMRTPTKNEKITELCGNVSHGVYSLCSGVAVIYCVGT